MHRGFFAKALDDHPEDPLSGKYGQSVLCAYRSASSFVALVKSVWSQHRSLTERNWFLFTHVFSCAVGVLFSLYDAVTNSDGQIVLGSIPTRCPSMGFARSAMNSLDQAYELFVQVAETERTRANKVLVRLQSRLNYPTTHRASIAHTRTSARPGTRRDGRAPVAHAGRHV